MDRKDDYLPDNLFSEGVVFALSSTWSGKVAGRSSSATLGGIYSTRERAIFPNCWCRMNSKPAPKTAPIISVCSSGHYLIEDVSHPGNGLGLFVKGAVTDGNPNPFQSYITAGLAGKGLIPGRPGDSFGLGYFYYNYSRDLKRAVNPLIGVEDDQGVEVYYTLEVTPWFHLTTDL